MGRLIQRYEALSHCELFEKSNCKLLMIQAQAGQGKTVLATQFKQQSKAKFAWLTCTAGIAGVQVLAERIVDALAGALPTFSAYDVSTIIKQRGTSAELRQIMSARIGAELEKMTESVILVLDDIQILMDSPDELLLLKELVGAVPDNVKFVWLSRFPLSLEGSPLVPLETTMVIDNELLAFSREEIAFFFNEVLGEAVGTRKINQLLEATEGWVSGLKILHSTGVVERLSQVADITVLDAYFNELIVVALTPNEQRELLLASLLDELPEALLPEILSGGSICWLQDMVAKNCFARITHERGQTFYRLHHLFQGYLLSDADCNLKLNTFGGGEFSK